MFIFLDDLRSQAVCTGFHGVAVFEVPGSIPGWGKVDNELLTKMSHSKHFVAKLVSDDLDCSIY